MSDHSLGRPQIIARRVDNPDKTRGWTSWITTTDHKKIGIMYIINSFLFFLIGDVFALIVRTELALSSGECLFKSRSFKRLRFHNLSPLLCYFEIRL